MEMKIKRKEFLTIREVAEILAVSQKTIRNLIYSRQLISFRVGDGGIYKIAKIDLEKFIGKQKDKRENDVLVKT